VGLTATSMGWGNGTRSVLSDYPRRRVFRLLLKSPVINRHCEPGESRTPGKPQLRLRRVASARSFWGVANSDNENLVSDHTRILGLLAEFRIYFLAYQGDARGETRRPVEPLAYRGNPQPLECESSGSRPGLSR
jgi:hypothetical protein